MVKVKRYAEQACNGLEVRIKSLTVTLLKTPQIIGACQILKNQNKASRFLIVTLNSLKRQWAKEIEKFTPLKALPIVGTATKREKLIREFGRRGDLSFMIVNYEMLRSSKLLKLIKSVGFDVVALDEGHKIRTGVTDSMLRLKPSGIAEGAYKLKDIPYRFIATATPLQGKPQEIWSLFHFIDEDILGPWEMFRERYTKYHPRWGISGAQNEGELYMRISPYFIRRTKEMPEIQQQLPTVKHDHVFLEMNETQERIQEVIIEKIEEVKEEMRTRMLTEEEQEKYDGMLQGLRTFLLENCDTPGLFLESDSNIIKQILSEAGVSYDKLSASPKAEHVKEFIKQVMYDEPSSKFVIFTRYETMARLLHEQIPQSVLYTGKISEQMKEYAKESFVTNPNTKVFISTEAGSTGMNLQVANYMIHVDMPDSPQDIEQRNGRIDRTGNTFSNVVIQYLVMSDGYDEQMLELMNKKAGMASAILEGGKMRRGSVDYNKLALDRMLKNKMKKSKKVAINV